MNYRMNYSKEFDLYINLVLILYIFCVKILFLKKDNKGDDV